MGKLDALAEGLERLKNPQEEPEPPPQDIEVQGEQLNAITLAVSSLGTSLEKTTKEQCEKLDESTTAQVIEIQSGLRKLVKAIEALAKGQGNSMTLAVKAQAESLQGAIAELTTAIGGISTPQSKVIVEQPAPAPVQFDIERDRNGYIATVIARPVQEKQVVEVSNSYE